MTVDEILLHLKLHGWCVLEGVILEDKGRRKFPRPFTASPHAFAPSSRPVRGRRANRVRVRRLH